MMSGTGTADEEFCRLDGRVIKLWRLGQLIRSVVWLGGLCFVGWGFLGAEVVGIGTWGSVVALAALLRIWLFFWYPRRAYQGWGYRIQGKVIETRHGIWFCTIQLLPLSRLQHVDLRSGPIERSFGLASLMLHTAGTHQALIVIPGLDIAEAARLRDQLVAAGGDDHG
jgi:uncharacterized protein